MPKVTADISMSVDGYVTGPEPKADQPLGRDGDRLHDWMFDARTEADARVRAETYAETGAIIMGRNKFDVGFEPWGDPPPFGMPVFVLTHQQLAPRPMTGGTTYRFVTEGTAAALKQAAAAARGSNVGIWGGANVIQQYLAAH